MQIRCHRLETEEGSGICGLQDLVLVISSSRGGFFVGFSEGAVRTVRGVAKTPQAVRLHLV
jgi:hypothetical protein